MKRYFGAKLPVINLVVSNLVFATLKFRLSYLRVKNFFKGITQKEEIKLVNDLTTRKQFEQFRELGYTKINVGGGPYNLDGYINLDFVQFEGVRNQVQANILDLSFIQKNTLSHIYSNQLLEHLSESQLIEQFRQYCSILTRDGVLSFRTPNALGISYGFWFGQVPEEGREEFVAEGYPIDAFFYDSRDGWYHKDLYALFHWWYADAGNIKNEHLTLFTPTKIIKLVTECGFEIVKITEPETSQIIVVAKKIQK